MGRNEGSMKVPREKNGGGGSSPCRSLFYFLLLNHLKLKNLISLAPRLRHQLSYVCR